MFLPLHYSFILQFLIIQNINPQVLVLDVSDGHFFIQDAQSNHRADNLLHGKKILCCLNSVTEIMAKQWHYSRVPVRAAKVGQPLAEPHLCPHRLILLKGKLVITTITPYSSSLCFPGGLQEYSVSSN